MTKSPGDFTQLQWEDNLNYWQVLHEIVDLEPPYDAYSNYYGELAALRSLFELKNIANSGSVDLFFGPNAPSGSDGRWIKTLPGKGWFVYFRIYGPDAPAFDGSWKPGDFEEVKGN